MHKQRTSLPPLGTALISVGLIVNIAGGKYLWARLLGIAIELFGLLQVGVTIGAQRKQK